MIKLLLVRAYAYARERVIIGIFTHIFLDSNIPPPLSSFSNVLLFFSVLPDLCKKQPVIFSKQPVIFNKTTRHFQQNDPSLSTKQRVINEFPKIYCIGQHSRKKNIERDYSSAAYNYGSGRTIYQGSKGGQFYYNNNGTRTYVPKRRF